MPSRAQQPLLPDASSGCGQAGGPDSGCCVIAVLMSNCRNISRPALAAVSQPRDARLNLLPLCMYVSTKASSTAPAQRRPASTPGTALAAASAASESGIQVWKWCLMPLIVVHEGALHVAQRHIKQHPHARYQVSTF